MKSKKHSLIKFSIFFAIGLFLFGIIAVLIDSIYYNNVFERKTFAYGVDISGLSVTEATNKIVSALNESDYTITLTYKDKQWEIYPNQQSMQTSIFEELTDQYNSVKHKTLTEKINIIKYFSKTEKNITNNLNFLITNFDDNLKEIISEIERETVEPEVNFSPNNKTMFTFKEGVTGLSVDKQKLFTLLDEAIKTGQKEINIPVEEIKPSTSLEQLKQNINLKSTFSTDFSTSTVERKNNVKLALKSLNGLIVNPNETISFNQTTGPRNSENGYKNAKIIYDGEFVDGMGGGVCQVSTTLYNALLLANIEVVKSSKHSLPVSYVEKGFDAMVSENGSDLVFKNNTLYPIYIKATAQNNKAYVEIYGTPNEYTIKERNEVVKTLPAPKDKIEKDTDQKYTDKVLFKGEYYRLKKGKTGYQVKTYLDYYKDGKFEFSKPLRDVTYKPQSGVLIEGIEDLPDSLQD